MFRVAVTWAYDEFLDVFAPLRLHQGLEAARLERVGLDNTAFGDQLGVEEFSHFVLFDNNFVR